MKKKRCKTDLSNQEQKSKHQNRSLISRHRVACFFLIISSIASTSFAGLFSSWVPFAGPAIDKAISGATSWLTDGYTTVSNEMNKVTNELGFDFDDIQNQLNQLPSPYRPVDLSLNTMPTEQYNALKDFPGFVDTFLSVPDHVKAVKELAIAVANKDTDSTRAAIYYVIRTMHTSQMETAVKTLHDHYGAESLLFQITVDDYTFGVAVDIDAYPFIIKDEVSSFNEDGPVLTFYMGYGQSIDESSDVTLAMGYHKKPPSNVDGKSYDITVRLNGFNIAMGFEPWIQSTFPTSTQVEDKHSATFITPVDNPNAGVSASAIFLKVMKNGEVQLPLGNIGIVRVELLEQPDNTRTSVGGVVFAWSNAGEIANMYCTSINDPQEPIQHTWGDNYFCSSENIGMLWFSEGPLPTDMKCFQISEPTDPEGWGDNYICLPADSPFTFSFYYAGDPGGTTVRWNEIVDPHNWGDNYLKIDYQSPMVTNLIYDDFDAEFYLEKNPDLRIAFGTNYQELYNHWVTWGRNEGRQATREFHLRYYIDTHDDLKTAFGYNYQAAYNHWLTYGINEGRRASEDFDINFYLEANPDLSAYFGNDKMGAYNHFKGFGRWMNAGQTNADGYRLFRP